MAKSKIKKNDEVFVVRGKDRDGLVDDKTKRKIKRKVLKVYASEGRAIVERVNMVKKHTRANPSQQVQGGVLEREAPIRMENLRLICPECGKPTRVGRKRLEDGSAARVCKRCAATFN